MSFALETAPDDLELTYPPRFERLPTPLPLPFPLKPLSFILFGGVSHLIKLSLRKFLHILQFRSDTL